MKEVRVHAVGDDVPIGVEIPSSRVHHGPAHRDRGRVPVEDALQRPPEHAIPDRAREPRMESRYHRDARAPRGERSREAERRGEPAVHVHDVEPAGPKDLLETPAEPPPGRHTRHAAVGVDHPARPDANHELGVAVVLAHPRGDDRRRMSPAVELEGEIVYVLGHASELRIVVLGDQGDAHYGTACPVEGIAGERSIRGTRWPAPRSRWPRGVPGWRARRPAAPRGWSGPPPARSRARTTATRAPGAAP